MSYADLDSPTGKQIRNLFWILTAVAALLIAPIRNPGFLDYMNHLARFFVMTRDFHTPFYQAHYVDNFHIIPNLGVDIVMMGLGRILPTEIALKLVVMGSIVLFCTGFYRLALRTQENKISPLVLLFPVLAYSFPLFLGFLNFFLGSALIPWALVALRSNRESRKWFVSVITWAMTLYFTHFFALLIFLFLAFVDAFLDPEKAYKKAHRITLAVASVLTVVMYKLSPSSHEQSEIVWSNLLDKAKYFFAAIAFGPYWPIPTALFFGLLAYILLRGKISFDSKNGKIVLAMAGLFLVCPFGLAITASYDARLPAILFAFIIALGTMKASSEALRKGLTIACVAVAAVHFSVTFVTMSVTDRETAKVASFMKPIPAGSSIVTVPINSASSRNRWTWWPNLNMIQFAGVPERPLHVHGLFSFKSEQPVIINDPVLKALSVPILDPSANLTVRQQEYDSWRGNLENLIKGTQLKDIYVLVIDFEHSGAKLKSTDEVLYQDKTFTLLRCLLPEKKG